MWKGLIKEVTGIESCPAAFFQNVGHFMFKELIKNQHRPTTTMESCTTPPPLTYEEINALRYVSGYIPRLLRKKLKKSTHKLKNDILLCIYDLLDDGDEVDDSTQDWIKCINRGGLIIVNNATFDVFLSIESELRARLYHDAMPPALSEEVKKEIAGCEDVQFFWSMLSTEWEEESGNVLLDMIVSQYVKIRGFSFASAWLEEYKQVNKSTTQKSKGVGKQLVPKDVKVTVVDDDCDDIDE